MSFSPGQRIRASDLNKLGQLAGRNTRTTDLTSTSGGTAVPVVSVRAAVKSGRTYLVSLWTTAYAATAGATTQHHLRYTTDDTEPTVSTTNYLGRGDIAHANAGQLYDVVVQGLYDATADGYLRVLHTLVRTSGSGNVSIGAGSINPYLLTVEDVGDTIAASGTAY